jgi:hypothetical protein
MPKARLSSFWVASGLHAIADLTEEVAGCGLAPEPGVHFLPGVGRSLLHAGLEVLAWLWMISPAELAAGIVRKVWSPPVNGRSPRTWRPAVVTSASRASPSGRCSEVHGAVSLSRHGCVRSVLRWSSESWSSRGIGSPPGHAAAHEHYTTGIHNNLPAPQGSTCSDAATRAHPTACCMTATARRPAVPRTYSTSTASESRPMPSTWRRGRKISPAT